MKLNWRRFSFNKSNRIGMLYFVLIILVLISLSFVSQYFADDDSSQWFTSSETQQLQRELDSLKQVEETSKDTIYPFNPNFLTDYKAYKLGMSVKEINRLLAFRERQKWVNSAKDFQNVTQVSDSLLNTLKPYFKFPDWVKEREKQSRSSQNIKVWSSPKDLNAITARDLQKIKGIGPALSKRIISYRHKLVNFRSLSQLKDVWGLSYEVRERLNENLMVSIDYQKIDLNTATIIQLAEIPYFDYELSRKIHQFVKVRQGVSDLKELGKLQDFPFDKIERIKLYLTVNK